MSVPFGPEFGRFAYQQVSIDPETGEEIINELESGSCMRIYDAYLKDTIDESRLTGLGGKDKFFGESRCLIDPNAIIADQSGSLEQKFIKINYLPCLVE